MPHTDRPPRGSTTASHRATRVTASWILVAVLCSIGISAASPRPAAAAPSAIVGPCETAAGVTIIVDFQDLGGGTQVYCAPNAPGSGLAALQQANVSHRTALRSGGFVCQIEGAPASDPCVFESPPNAYWSYWLAPRGGEWCFSNLGAAGRTPPAGSVEGWSFSLNNAASQTPPPRLGPPPGVTPGGIPASHCTAPNRGMTPTTAPPVTAPPATSPPATSAPGGATGGSGSGSGSNPSSGSGGQTGGPSSGESPTRADGSTKPGDPSNKSSTAEGGDGSSSAGKTGDGSTPSKNGTSSKGQDPENTAGAADETQNAPGSSAGKGAAESASARAADQEFQDELAAINAGATRPATGGTDKSSGSPVPLIFAAVAAIALLGIGVRASRRNRAAS